MGKWQTRQQPWAMLPEGLSAVLLPHLETVADDLLEAAQHDVPDYAAVLRGASREPIRQRVLVSLARFLEVLGTNHEALTEEQHRLHLRLGHREFQQGRPLNALFAAYRSGARTTLHSLSQHTMAAGYGAAVLVGLAESVFAYIEELSAAGAEGYAMERSERAGERDRLREAAATLLIRGDADEAAVRAAAHAAGWRLPERIVVAVLDTDHHARLRTRLDDRSLLLTRARGAVLIAPEPLGAAQRAGLETALAGHDAMIGPGRPWSAAGESLALAETARGLLAADAPQDRSARWVTDHLPQLILTSNRVLVDELAQQRLGPLRHLKDGPQGRLRATLLSWLRHQGHRSPMAAELGVHGQTVGYRLHQLRALFGDQLDDPQSRFELELALRAREHDATA